MKTILVTGGAGFVGSHACKALSRAGYLPVTFDSLEHGHERAVKWGPLERGNLRNETDLHRALGFDHSGRVDVAVNPSDPEGIWIRRYLKSRKIPYYAFTHAMRGKATAAHIHIGPGSTRLHSAD